MNSVINYSDFYKVNHRPMYPDKTGMVYTNLTARGSRIPGVDKVVVFGIQYFIREYLINQFDDGFFNQPRELAVSRYKRRLDNALGKDTVDIEHISELHKLQYLPLLIKALPEGSLCPLRIPLLTIRNTLPEFFWLTNFLETIMSTTIWGPITSATIAHEYRKVLGNYAKQTSDNESFVDWQGHDFSMRGMYGLEAAKMSGAAHLLSFTGTDTIPAIDFLEEYYNADSDKELVGGSVPASEHSVACMGSEDTDDFPYFERMLNLFPKGVVSIVADTYDYWRFVSEYTVRLKSKILSREGKCVLRPDSGDPVKIICGDNNAYGDLKLNGTTDCPERKGSVEVLWDIFGGTVNNKGYKELDPHIGLIYGDSITLERARAICEGLKQKGFASTNIVYGIGSYCVSPDTPILCSDLIWRKAKELNVGQEIIAFDEDPQFGENKRAARRFKTATINANNLDKKECSKISTDLGNPIIASNDHPWLVWAENRNRKNIYYNKEGNESDPRTAGLIWKKTNELKIGDKIAFLGKPWKNEDTRNNGWLSGIYDGEGSLSRSTGNVRIPSWKVMISQNKGLVLNKIKEELDKRNFQYYEMDRGCRSIVLTGGWYETLRFLGTVNPIRLMEKNKEMVKELPALSRDRTYQLSEIKSIDNIGIHEVSSITTSSGTFITDGYLSHNTYQHVTRDTFGLAMKATYGEIDGKPVEIYKNPKTDSGIKKSAKGLLRVNEDYTLSEQVDWDGESEGLLQVVFDDGQPYNETSLSQIRERLKNNYV